MCYRVKQKSLKFSCLNEMLLQTQENEREDHKILCLQTLKNCLKDPPPPNFTSFIKHVIY